MLGIGFWGVVNGCVLVQCGRRGGRPSSTSLVELGSLGAGRLEAGVAGEVFWGVSDGEEMVRGVEIVDFD